MIRFTRVFFFISCLPRRECERSLRGSAASFRCSGRADDSSGLRRAVRLLKLCYSGFLSSRYSSVSQDVFIGLTAFLCSGASVLIYRELSGRVISDCRGARSRAISRGPARDDDLERSFVGAPPPLWPPSLCPNAPFMQMSYERHAVGGSTASASLPEKRCSVFVTSSAAISHLHQFLLS